MEECAGSAPLWGRAHDAVSTGLPGRATGSTSQTTAPEGCPLVPVRPPPTDCATLGPARKQGPGFLREGRVPENAGSGSGMGAWMGVWHFPPGRQGALTGRGGGTHALIHTQVGQQEREGAPQLFHRDVCRLFANHRQLFESCE